MAVEDRVWGDAALLEQNRLRLRQELRQKIRGYEARFELSSDRVEDELKAGRLRETREVCDWIIAFRAYRTLEHER